MAAAKRWRRGGVNSSGAVEGDSSAAAASASSERREQRDLVAGGEHLVGARVPAVDEDDPRGPGFETESLDQRAHGGGLGRQEGLLCAA